MLDLVCVFCFRDVSLQLLQASSIARFLERAGLGTVTYVWHDTRAMPGGLQGELASRLEGIPLRLLTAAELGVGADAIAVDGWSTQQALKLLCSEIVQTESYLVLDAKNHFLRSCSAQDFLAEDFRGRFASRDLTPDQLESFQFCLDYFGYPQTREAVRAVPNLTPFLLRSSIVKKLLAALRAKDGTIAEQFITHRDKLTEFFAYQAYAITQGLELSALYEEVAPNSAILWGNLNPGSNAFDSWLQLMREETMKIAGLHWTACRNMFAAQRLALGELWLERGLIKTLQEGEEIIESVKQRIPDGDEKLAAQWWAEWVAASQPPGDST